MPAAFYVINLFGWTLTGAMAGAWDLLWLVVLPLLPLVVSGANSAGNGVTPDFNLLLAGGIVFALPVLTFIWWRFGGPDTLAFVIVSGAFTATMDFISAFVAQNYAYPGQSRLWVFTYIFFGWIGICGSCVFIAEGIFARRGADMLTQPQRVVAGASGDGSDRRIGGPS